MSGRLTWFFVNLAGFLAMIYVNYLSINLPLNGYTPQDLSEKYENLFVPAGFTFSIWGIIYTMIIIFLVGQLVAALNNSSLYDNVKSFFLQTCILNSFWLVAWHYEYITLSLLIMISLLLTLIQYYLKNDFGTDRYSFLQKILIHAPFSLYLGWISVATIANVTTFLVNSGWDGAPIGEANITAVMIITAALLGMIMQFRRGDVLYGLVIIWALYGIYAKRTSVDLNPDFIIIYALLGGMVCVALTIFFNVLKRRQLLA